MTTSELSALLLLATASSFTPGPNTTLSTALAANRGLRGSLHFVCAVPVGWGVLFALCALGLGQVVLAAPTLRGGIWLLGTGYLLWLAARLSQASHLVQADPARLNVTFWQGVTLQFLNIKAWMLALTVVAGWIAGQPDATERTWQVLPVMMAFGLVSNLTYATMGALLRHWLQGPWDNGQPSHRRLQRFNRTMALALVLTAAWMAWGFFQ